MIYVEISDRLADLQVFLDGGHYSLSDLVDIIAEHMDGSTDDYSEDSCSDDDFEHRVLGDLLSD